MLSPFPQKSSAPRKSERRGPAFFLTCFLLAPDTWRILAGTIAAILLTPRLLPVDRTVMGRYVLFIMIVVVGWAVTAAPARWLTGRLQSFFKSS